MKTQTRNCWPVLAQKARDAVTQAQTELAQAQDKAAQLQASLEKVSRMYDEYRKQEISPAITGLGMQDRMNQRQFMNQLLSLQQRVLQDLGAAQSAVEKQRKKLIMAELEAQKMDKLVENDQQAVRKTLDRLDQARLDELGVMRFNLRATG